MSFDGILEVYNDIEFNYDNVGHNGEYEWRRQAAILAKMDGKKLDDFLVFSSVWNKYMWSDKGYGLYLHYLGQTIKGG